MAQRPSLIDGYTDIPVGRLAAIATSLEMLVPPASQAAAGDRVASIHRVERPTAEWYRDLYRRIGEPWLWQSRLRLEAGELEGIIRSPDVEVWAVDDDGRDEGLLELDFRVPGECELTFFGLTGGLVGQGVGRQLMSVAIARAWTRPIRRFWLHTCTLDHPAALPFYVRSGFRPFKRQVEVFADPRIDGTLAADAAPAVPLL